MSRLNYWDKLKAENRPKAFGGLSRDLADKYSK